MWWLMCCHSMSENKKMLSVDDVVLKMKVSGSHCEGKFTPQLKVCELVYGGLLQ